MNNSLLENARLLLHLFILFIGGYTLSTGLSAFSFLCILINFFIVLLCLFYDWKYRTFQNTNEKIINHKQSMEFVKTILLTTALVVSILSIGEYFLKKNIPSFIEKQTEEIIISPEKRHWIGESLIEIDPKIAQSLTKEKELHSLYQLNDKAFIIKSNILIGNAFKAYKYFEYLFLGLGLLGIISILGLIGIDYVTRFTLP